MSPHEQSGVVNDQAASPNHNGSNDIFVDARPNQPNSARRRCKPADLQRANVTPSRVNRIKDIFKEAALTLASTPPPSGYTLRYADVLESPTFNPGKQTVRLSVHKADSDYFVQSSKLSHQPSLPNLRSPRVRGDVTYGRAGTPSPFKAGREPLSSGHNTPSKIPRPISNLSKAGLQPGFTYGEDSEDEDIHSTHGVPLILPIHESKNVLRTSNNIARWLDSVENTSPGDHDAETANKSKTSQTRSSDGKRAKENMHPIRFSPDRANASNISSKIAHHGTKEKQGNHAKCTPPTGLLRLPPRRIGVTPGISGKTKIPQKLPRSENQSQDGNIQRGAIPLEDDLVELSPSVIKIRKHRSPPKHARVLATEEQEFFRTLQMAEDEEERERGRQMHRV